MEVDRGDGDNENYETEDEEDCEGDNEDEEDCEGGNEEMAIGGEISEIDNDGADYIELLQSDLDALDDDFDVDSMPDLISISDADDDNVRYFDDALSEIGDESSCLQLSAISCN